MTIYDIAREAGVSPATVSRVLTGNARVSPEKRARVESLLEKHNFQPNELARSLVRSRTKSIGLLIADVQNEYYSSLFRACSRAAEERGYSLMVANGFSELDAEYHALTRFEEQQMDVIAVIGGMVDRIEPPEGFVERLEQLRKRIPVLVLGEVENCSCPSIRLNDRSAMKDIMDHLAKMGNRRCAIIGGMKEVRSTLEKNRQFRELSSEYGFELHEEYIGNWSDYTIEGAFLAAEIFFEKLRKKSVPFPEAIVTINDLTAAGVLHYCHMHGIRVPEDISLVSFDNTSFSRVLSPPLSSVDYGYDDYGTLIADTAIRLAENKEVPLVQEIETRLVVRISSGYQRNTHVE